MHVAWMTVMALSEILKNNKVPLGDFTKWNYITF